MKRGPWVILGGIAILVLLYATPNILRLIKHIWILGVILIIFGIIKSIMELAEQAKVNQQIEQRKLNKQRSEEEKQRSEKEQGDILERWMDT